MIMRKFLIFLSFILAFILDILPLSAEFSLLRPWFSSLLVIYWAIYGSKSLSFVTVFALGIMLDLILAAPLAQHSLTFGLALFVALKLRRIIRVFPLWQQGASVFMILALVQFVDLTISWLLSDPISFSALVMRTATSAIIWPLLVLIMAQYQQKLA